MRTCANCNRCYDDDQTSCEEPGHGPSEPSRLGFRVINSKYRLDRLLGHGGMSSVYAGVHLALDRRVAIKLLKPESISDGTHLERLRREARIASRLNHPNVVTTYDYDLVSKGESYIAMELIEGQTLESYLKTNITLPVSTAIRIIRQVAEGMSAAHEQGILHRDLKPANIMLTTRDDGELQAKVIDFGVAKLVKQTLITEGELTPPDHLVGTHNYMSPEECEGKPQDQRADIYSLGCVLYRMLAGKPPFVLRYPAIIFAHISEQPTPLGELRAGLPPQLVSVVMCSLEKEPKKRPGTATELVRQLVEIEQTGYPTEPQTARLAASAINSSIESDDDTVVQVKLAGDTTPTSPIKRIKGMKVRIYALAKELRLDTKRLIEEIRLEGVDVRVPSNTITDELATKITEKLSAQGCGSEEYGAKIRLYQLAKELKVDTRRVIEEVRREGVDVSVPSNSISPIVANKIRQKCLPKNLVAGQRLGGDTPALTRKAVPRVRVNAIPTEQSRPVRHDRIVVPIGGEALSEHLKSAKLFIDTSSLMHVDAPSVFLNVLRSALVESRSRLVVPVRVFEELKKHQLSGSTGRQDVERRTLAMEGLKILNELQSDGLVDWGQDSTDQFPDALFISLFSKFRTIHPLSLMTQDVSLMVEVLELQSSYSVQRIKPITIWEISQRSLRTVDLDTARSRRASQQSRRSGVASAQHGSIEPTHFSFKKVSQLYGRSEQTLPVSRLISTGSTLRTTNQGPFDLTLGVRIDWGGEGEVFETSHNGLVAKIYYPENLTNTTFEKLTLMASKQLPKLPETKGICWPLDLLTDQDGVPRGYLMHKAIGSALGTCIFVRDEMLRHFPDWDRRQLVALCRNLIRKVTFLHSANIIVGDLNQWNILVENENSIFLIDTDSYQVEGYPCPVGTEYFTAPEIQGMSFPTALRTFDHEAFALATMLFMILHAGKQPYAQQGGGSPSENIQAMKFPYPLGKKTTGTAPPGPWKFIWSNLPFLLKQAFYETFDFSCRDLRRRTTSEWLELLDEYAYLLKWEYRSRELFPTTLKRISDYDRTRFGVGESKDG